MTLTEERSAPVVNEARRAMIVSQLRTSGVNEPWVLGAMAGVAREDYVAADWKEAAYIDRAVPAATGGFLAAPLFYGRALSEAAPGPKDKVVLVGDAQGYFAALLCGLVGSLETVGLADAAAGSANLDGCTLLVIDGAVEALPETLLASVPEGCRIVTGEVLRGVTRLAVGRKTAGVVSLLPVGEMGIPVLPEFAAPKRWSF